MGDETKFNVMCSLFNWMQRSKSATKKRSKFRKFLDTFCKSGDFFGAIRLLLPSLDRERNSYGLKESVLATCLVDALGMSRESEDALRLFNWRKGGPRTGANAGNFSLVASEVLQRRQGLTSGGLTIIELNELLDRLASSDNRVEKTAVLSDLIKKTNAQEMKWVIMIILKDLKLGVSEKSIFHEFHPDAEDLFNVTCDLKLVCEKLRDRNQRHKRQDIEVGKPVRPQLAMRIDNANIAWKKLHGKEVVVECKFDGDRIQIHKNGQEIHFFSRNFLDHPEYGHSMSDVIMQNILVERCILDGEMLVWDTSMKRFTEFGSNQEIARTANEELDSDRQLCYVAFDILYVGDTSVIHQSLRERHELLRKVVNPMKGRLQILVPNGGLNDHRPSGEPCWSLIAYNLDDIERFFKETIENRDEGIVLKDLGSKWEPSDRRGKWLKLKPDYVRPGSDLDVLIIGGYYGSGRRGGEVAQFLVGLAERSAPNTYPRRFISFCRVGTGLSDEELDAVVTKLKPFFRKSEYPKKASPSFYEVTNNSKERPDVWIESPEKSIILSITSDIRTIRSEVFSAPYSLRFPRIDRVRYDKPWHECLDVQSFVELVHSSNGTMQKGAGYGAVQDNKPKRMKSSRKGEKRSVLVVPQHFVQTDVSHIKGETLIFSNMVFYFVNMPPTHSLDSLHKMVAENGGTFSMNLNNSVTHSIAAESKGIKFQAAKLRGDIIHYSWLFDCCSHKKLLPLQTKYFLFLSDSSRKKLREEIDEFSDPYFGDLDIEDIKQLLSNINRSEDSKIIDYYKGKFCPKNKWSRFHGCCIYFHPSSLAVNSDSKVLIELALRRMKLEVSMGGGKVSNSLSQATHLVVISPLGFDVDFNSILRRNWSRECTMQFTKVAMEGEVASVAIKPLNLLISFSSVEVCLLRKKSLRVVGCRWLEDCFDKEQKLQEETYSLKPADFEESNSGDWKKDSNQGDFSSIENVEQQNMSSSPSEDGKQRKSQTAPNDSRLLTFPQKDAKRKRGRPTSASLNKGKVSVIHPRRTRPRLGNKSAKIHDNESDLTASLYGNAANEVSEIEIGNHEIHGVAGQESQETKGKVIVEDSETLKERWAVNPQEVGEGSIQSEWFDKAYGIELDGGNNARDSVKLEIMVDPVQSMLLDMIPSLGAKKVDSTDPVVEVGKPPEDNNAEPVKKKRVSYKDVASELLKDW
ncbi:DNA ligase 4 isoform X2 [Actinidia eriantha]|uniref:DNA ligase 4 isoform X2 n=1 Tax=Actinidia eriantha TaxID=165200 RepID=UPI00258B8DB8|nr:DNA ligase 4 isoform X2 [Actinidia eriantha]